MEAEAQDSEAKSVASPAGAPPLPEAGSSDGMPIVELVFAGRPRFFANLVDT